MKKLLYYVAIPVLLAFVLIQFFKPKKNTGQLTEDHIFMHDSLNVEVKEILSNACMDCHSNNTNYLWYHNMAPISFMINNHIKKGKEELNLSHWGTLDALDKMGKLDEISEVVIDESMPLKAYSLMHKKAQLNADERAEIVAWSEKYAEEILIELSEQ